MHSDVDIPLTFRYWCCVLNTYGKNIIVWNTNSQREGVGRQVSLRWARPPHCGIYAGITLSAPCPSRPTRTQQDCIIYEPGSGIASVNLLDTDSGVQRLQKQPSRFVNCLNFTVICSRLDLKRYKEWILREKAKSILFNYRIPKISGVCICCRTHGTRLQSVFHSWCRGRPSDTVSTA